MLLDGQEILLTRRSSALREIRGNEIAMIFQDPMTSLNPVQEHRLAARGGGARPPGRHDARSPAQRAIEILEGGRASRAPTSASTTIRTSSRAACGSA